VTQAPRWGVHRCRHTTGRGNPYRVPNLQLDLLVHDLDHACAELDADGEIVHGLEALVGELKQQAGLAYACSDRHATGAHTNAQMRCTTPCPQGGHSTRKEKRNIDTECAMNGMTLQHAGGWLAKPVRQETVRKWAPRSQNRLQRGQAVWAYVNMQRAATTNEGCNTVHGVK
jgi:hypothetical protein